MISPDKKYSEEELRRTWLQDFLMKNKSKKNENQIILLKDLLNLINANDPKFRVFMKQQISKYHKAEKQNQFNRELIRRLKIQNSKLLKQLEKMKIERRQSKAIVKDLTEQANSLTKFNRTLAEALGACPVCWGNNTDCKSCSGNGSPGWVKPIRKLFNLYVLPVWQHSIGKSVGSG